MRVFQCLAVVFFSNYFCCETGYLKTSQTNKPLGRMLTIFAGQKTKGKSKNTTNQDLQQLIISIIADQ